MTAIVPHVVYSADERYSLSATFTNRLEMSETAARAHIEMALADERARKSSTWPAIAIAAALVVIVAMLVGACLFAASKTAWDREIVLTFVGAIAAIVVPVATVAAFRALR